MQQSQNCVTGPKNSATLKYRAGESETGTCEFREPQFNATNFIILFVASLRYIFLNDYFVSVPCVI